MEQPDLLIVGAGPVGCTIAERAASVLGWRSLIVERRGHIAGNCHDQAFGNGVLIHRYGPHYFRTDNDEVFNYLSRFTGWIPGNYIAKASVRGQLHPFPINLDTLEQFFGRPLDESSARSLLNQLKLPMAEPRNSEELVLSRVGRELYEAFYLGYTLKQWGKHPRELAPSVCGRIPVRFNRDPSYVDARHRVMPMKGYTALFQKMIDDARITVLLSCSHRDVPVIPKRATIYSGPIDEYFDHCFGPLPWRSIELRFEAFAAELVQPCVQINHPDEHEYTRSVEIKHVTGQVHPQTVISYEYPGSKGEPSYPVPTAANEALYRRYQVLAEEEERARCVYFTGRLARYRYINTDEAIAMALETFEKIRRRFSAP